MIVRSDFALNTKNQLALEPGETATADEHGNLHVIPADGVLPKGWTHDVCDACAGRGVSGKDADGYDARCLQCRGSGMSLTYTVARGNETEPRGIVAYLDEIRINPKGLMPPSAGKFEAIDAATAPIPAKRILPENYHHEVCDICNGSGFDSAKDEDGHSQLCPCCRGAGKVIALNGFGNEFGGNQSERGPGFISPQPDRPARVHDKCSEDISHTIEYLIERNDRERRALEAKDQALKEVRERVGDILLARRREIGG